MLVLKFAIQMIVLFAVTALGTLLLVALGMSPGIAVLLAGAAGATVFVPWKPLYQEGDEF